MDKKRPIILYKRIVIYSILSLLIGTGCQTASNRGDREKTPGLNIKKIVVLGFKPTIEQLDKTSKSVLKDASSKQPEIFEKMNFMTSRLFGLMLQNNKEYEFINPDRYNEALSRISSSSPGINDAEIQGKIAQELKIDAMVIGHLFRWKDREGTDYSVKQSASVAFDLCLVNPGDGSILWEKRFDKTQKSLSENLLDIRTFFKGKGKWMTADDLSALGLNDLVNELFLFMHEGKETKN